MIRFNIFDSGGISMFKNNIGYIFECKKDSKGTIGVKESFSFSYRGDIQRVNAIFSVDMYGKILMPSFFEKASGFNPLNSIITSENDMDAFVRSHRATYSVFPASYLICVFDGKISKTSGEWVDDAIKINLYVPNFELALGKIVSNSSEELGVACSVAAPAGKLNTCIMSEDILNSYKHMILKQLKGIIVGDKQAYLYGRIRNSLSIQ